MIRLKYIYVNVFVLVFCVLFAAENALAQTQNVRLPRPSQKATVSQTIGVTDVTITYSRPGVKGRKIWGDWPSAAAGTATLDDQRSRPKDAVIVPYGHVWRTGANEATMFSVTDDVLINGQKLAAGTYSLHTLPGKDEWLVIFNSDSGQWGSFDYDEKKDVLRVKAKPQVVSENQEWLMFDFPVVTANSAQVQLSWEKLVLSFTVEVPNVEAVAIAKVKTAMASNPEDWRAPLQVANMYANDSKWDDALRWIDDSIKVKQTFQNLSAKSRILWLANRKQEALTVGDQAIERGKADKVDVGAFEKRLAEMRAGK